MRLSSRRKLSRKARQAELVPALAAQAFSRELHVFEQLLRDRMHFAFGMAAGAEVLKAAVTPVIDQGLGEDAAGRLDAIGKARPPDAAA
jgi:hypothetical protein